IASLDFGLDWVELRGMWNKNLMRLDAKEIEEARRLLERYRLRVSDLASPLFKVDWPGAPRSKFSPQRRDLFGADFTFEQRASSLPSISASTGSSCVACGTRTSCAWTRRRLRRRGGYWSATACVYPISLARCSRWTGRVHRVRSSARSGATCSAPTLPLSSRTRCWNAALNSRAYFAPIGCVASISGAWTTRPRTARPWTRNCSKQPPRPATKV